MLARLLEVDAHTIQDFLTFYVPALIISLGVGIGLGWLAAHYISRRWSVPREEDVHSWLLYTPFVPLLAVGSLLLALAGAPFIVNVLFLSLLLAPASAVLSLRLYAAKIDDKVQTRIDREKILRTGWIDIAFVVVVFLVGAFFYEALVVEPGDGLERRYGTINVPEQAAEYEVDWPRLMAYDARGNTLRSQKIVAEDVAVDARGLVTDALGELPLALVLGIALGAALGVGLGLSRHRLDDYLTRRHNAEQYHPLFDGPLGAIQYTIEAVLNQLHASPLVGVLMVAAASLSFTQLNRALILPLLLAAPITSAMIALLLVDDPDPDEPGIWQHMRIGFMNIFQISASFLIGAAMVGPLFLIYELGMNKSDLIMTALETHLDLTFTSLSISIFMGVLGGILASRFEVLEALLINLGNIGRTLPSLAVLALALPILSALDDAIPSVHIQAIGRNPSLVALIFIGVLPILVNTSVGIIGVLADIKESARGMGMNDLQVLSRVEIPIAMPVIMAGVRTSAVLVVASAALAGFIGGGGLGDLIYRGDSSSRDDLLLSGAILATLLAIFLEYFFGWLENLLTPRGLRETI
jgi:ABC-type proline/glycine betaine transport system permease subunit